MHSIGLLILVFGFIALAEMLLLLMYCNVVESHQFNDSDLYWHATEVVNKLGGVFRVRIFCCWTLLPVTLIVLLNGFIMFTLY